MSNTCNTLFFNQIYRCNPLSSHEETCTKIISYLYYLRNTLCTRIQRRQKEPKWNGQLRNYWRYFEAISYPNCFVNYDFLSKKKNVSNTCNTLSFNQVYRCNPLSSHEETCTKIISYLYYLRNTLCTRIQRRQKEPKWNGQLRNYWRYFEAISYPNCFVNYDFLSKKKNVSNTCNTRFFNQVYRCNPLSSHEETCTKIISYLYYLRNTLCTRIQRRQKEPKWNGQLRHYWRV